MEDKLNILILTLVSGEEVIANVKDHVEEEFILKDWDAEWISIGANDLDYYKIVPQQSGFIQWFIQYASH